MKCIVLVFLFLLSIHSFADSNHEVEYRSAEKDKSVFQLLYGGDASKIINVYKIRFLQGLEISKVNILKVRQTTLWSMPKDHKVNCKKFFEKEAKCPLNDKFYYLIYTLHEAPLADSKISGALFMGKDFSSFKKDMTKDSIEWKAKILSLDGRKQNRTLLYPDDQPDYSLQIFLKDSLKIKNSNGNYSTWIRFIDSPELKPVWFLLDQLYADDNGAVVDQWYKEQVTPVGLEKGKPFVFNFKDIRNEYLPVKITSYAKGETSEVISEVPLEDYYSWGNLCFDKIENGKLYFRRQIINNIEKPYLKSPEPDIRKNYEYFRERHNDLPDTIFSMDLSEYLKHNFIRSIVPGANGCDFDTFHMDKGLKLKEDENKMLWPLMQKREKAYFHEDTYK